MRTLTSRLRWAWIKTTWATALAGFYLGATSIKQGVR